MSGKPRLTMLFLVFCLLWPLTGSAQSQMAISREFVAKTVGPGPSGLDGLCGTLDIPGGTGWLFIEVTLSSYVQTRKPQITQLGYGGKEGFDYWYVDCGRYYLPDITIGDKATVLEPRPEVAGQPFRYAKWTKLGRNLEPFVLKICKSAKGAWMNLDDLNQFAQAVAINAWWVQGEEDPGYGPGESPAATQASDDLTGIWTGYNAAGQDLGDNRVTQDGKSIVFVHPNGQVTSGAYLVDESSMFVPAWGSTGIISADRTRIDFKGGSLNGISMVRK